jgi:hypothetical protein
VPKIILYYLLKTAKIIMAFSKNISPYDIGQKFELFSNHNIIALIMI